jgi:hypothetical protein
MGVKEMKQKVKLWLLAGLLAATLVPLSSCTFLERLTSPIERLVHPPALTTYTAILDIQLSGIPRIDEYYEKTVGAEEAEAHGKIGVVTATGNWDAHYKGKGMWVVTGPVLSEKWGECMTTWTINEKTSELALTGFTPEEGQ